MKAYFLSVILVFAWILHVDTTSSIDAKYIACVRRELGEEAHLSFRFEVSTPEEGKCYRQCGHESVDAIVNGKVNPKNVKNIFGAMPKVFIHEYTPEQCIALTETGKCELGDKLTDCLFKRRTDPVDRKAPWLRHHSH